MAFATALFLAAFPLRAQLSPNNESARVMRLDRFVLPEFPPFLRQLGVLQGTVVAAIGRTPGDAPHDILILESSDPRFSDATLDAIREWKFKPLEKTAAAANDAPVVRFLFTTGAVSVVPLTTAARVNGRRAIRADTPIELPNFTHLDRPPALVQNVVPELPATYRHRTDLADIGVVVVKYFVDPTGRVRLPSIVSARDPAIGDAVLAAIRQWRYEPPRIDGQPVVALERITIEINPAPKP